jgi:serine/threonine-protein kinase
MRLNTPLVTLLSGAALGVGVLVASMLSTSSTASASGAAATSPATATTTITLPSASSASVAAPASAPGSPPASAPTSASATSPTSASATSPGAASNAAPGTAPAATASTHQADVPPKADYVAQVNGGGAAVAISVDAGHAVAYICNGHGVAAWYRGTAAAGGLHLTGKNGARLNVEYRTGRAAGSIMADGTKYTFSAPVVGHVRPGRRRPGLYEATGVVDGVSVKAGWVVLPNGGQLGSVEYDPSSAVPPTAQAPALDLTTGTAQYDGITLVASLISGITGSGF